MFLELPLSPVSHYSNAALCLGSGGGDDFHLINIRPAKRVTNATKSALYFGIDRLGGKTPNSADRTVGSNGVMIHIEMELKTSNQ